MISLTDYFPIGSKMQAIIQDIAQNAIQKNWEEITLPELKQLSEKYPFAQAFQLLYAQKLKEENSPEYANQWQKALLQSNNPFFLHSIFAYPKKGIITNEEIDSETIRESEKGDSEPIPQLKIEAIDPATAELSFTPYYTVDYFASQGIKISDIKSTDQFANQLKSFTDWLKQMRRLPEAQITLQLTTKDEKLVEKIAANSVSDNDAVTEAMAEVWQKQGNIQKSIQTYQKWYC